MNALFLVFLAVVGFASAQYSCTPGFCSQNNGLLRTDVLGCLYFCYLDVTPDEQLFRDEFHTRYNEWIGTATECNLDCYLTAHRVILPACDNEITAAFNLLSVMDGVEATVSHADIDFWFDEVLAVQETPEPILSTAFQTWFRQLASIVGDPECDLPYP